MNRIFKICLLVSVVSLVFLFIEVYRINRQKNDILQIEDTELKPFIKDGDIICRMGGKAWSPIIKEISPRDKRFSHVGIIRVKDNIVSVIHTEGLSKNRKDRVKEVDLHSFLIGSRSVGLYRFNNNGHNTISDIALEYIGYPFDWDFDMDDDSKLYCTELLYVVLKRINPTISLNIHWLEVLNKFVIPIDIVSQDEYFTEIGYWEK